MIVLKCYYFRYSTCWNTEITILAACSHVLGTELVAPLLWSKPSWQCLHDSRHQPEPLFLTHCHVPPSIVHVTEILSLHLTPTMKRTLSSWSESPDWLLEQYCSLRSVKMTLLLLVDCIPDTCPHLLNIIKEKLFHEKIFNLRDVTDPEGRCCIVDVSVECIVHRDEVAPVWVNVSLTVTPSLFISQIRADWQQHVNLSH